MIKKYLSGLLSIIMIIALFVACKSNDVGVLPENDGQTYNYYELVNKWKNNSFAHFTLDGEIEYSQAEKQSKAKLSEIVFSQNDGNKVTSFYRRYTYDTINQTIKTQYASDEYFDGVYFYYNQNGEKSYEKYLATDFISNSRLCSANYIFNFSDTEIKQAKLDGSGIYNFTIENCDNYKQVVVNLLRLSDNFNANDVSITSLFIQMYTQNDVLTKYDISADFTAPDGITATATAQIEFIADSGEVYIPSNLSSYLTQSQKAEAQDKAESLFEDKKPVENYEDKKQEIIDQFGDAGEEIIDKVEQENNYKPQDEPSSSTQDESSEQTTTEPSTSSQAQSDNQVSSQPLSSDNSSSENISSTTSTTSIIISEIPDISGGGIDIEFVE